MKTYLTLAAASLALAACGNDRDTTDTTDDTAPAATTSVDADSMPPAAGDMAMPTDAKGFAAKAGAGDMWEIESSRALLAKSKNAEVRKFAEMMVKHHGESTAKVKAAAKTANVMLGEPMMDAMQQRALDEIKNADAAAIDKIYLDHQKMAHDQALALHQGYAANGDTEAFKKAAGEIAPVVKSHIEMLGKMDASPS